MPNDNIPDSPDGYAATSHVTVPVGILQAAYHALQSYAHGNAAPALAEACAEQIAELLPIKPEDYRIPGDGARFNIDNVFRGVLDMLGPAYRASYFKNPRPDAALVQLVILETLRRAGHDGR